MPALPPPSLVIGAISLLAELARTQSRQEQELAIAQLQAGVLHDLIDAVVHKRVDAIRAGFEGVLSQFSEQSSHHIRLQARYMEEELTCTDAIRRLELQSRIRAVDLELQTIRIDAHLIYVRMLDALNQMGVPCRDFANTVTASLALDSRNTDPTYG